MDKVWIGTSGWSYDHWRGRFYPEELPRETWLDYCAERFSSLEVNASFYRLPEPKALHNWMRHVPDKFLFAFKASRYLTHVKKLKPTGNGRARMLRRARVLREHLGPILFQLPPHWHADEARLADFLGSLPAGYRYAFEFRDESWWCDAIFSILERHGAAAVWSDFARRRAPLADTGDFRYVRWHGPNEKPYTGRYGRNRLRPLAQKIREWRAAGEEVFVYFDNDEAAYAAADAMTLRRMLA